MLDSIQALRHELKDGFSRIAVELNTSCPNIRGKPPPAYSFSTLHPLLDVLAMCWSKDPSLTIGLKLAPYVSSIQFQEVIDEVAPFSLTKGNPFAFFTCTNTLGSCLLFENQTTLGEERSGFALEPVVGGLAGESIHALSLGNVYMFTQSLAVHKDESVRRIKIIGVGGVTSADGAKRMKDAGACVVGCATLLGREGVVGFEKLSSGLV
jgi:dihydroorotate dehydrogenase (fumarate)